MARSYSESDGEFLSADALRTYGLIADGENVPAESADSVAELVAWGCVTFDQDGAGRPIALNPQDAAKRRLDAMLKENAARIAHMAALPQVTDQLSQHFQRAQWRAGGGSEYLDDAAVVNVRLDDVVASAEWEILAAQPGGPRNEVQLNRSLVRDTLALDRGVTKRTLYRDTVRDNSVTAEYARAMSTRMSGRRAEYRTLVGPFERCIVVDRRVAFISNHLVEGAPDHSAWQITDRAMVAYIAAEFDAKWRRADVWHGELRGRGPQPVDTVSGPAGAGVRTSLRQREILRDVVAGREQRVTAQRLGISLRTLGVEIADLKDLFDAASLPELTFKWALSPDRLVDDNAPDGYVGGEVAESAA